MVRDENSELYAKREKLLKELWKLAGNKKLMFSDAYIKKCGCNPTLGDVGNEMSYYGISRKYVMCPCRVVYTNNNGCTEFGAEIHRYSICRYFDGQNVKRIALADLFVKDLEKILSDIQTYLWWESDVHFPQIQKEYKETLALKEKFEKYLEDV